MPPNNAKTGTKLHPKLVRSYTLEGLLDPKGKLAAPDALAASAQKFLAEMVAAEERQFPSIGHGIDHRCKGKALAVVGSTAVGGVLARTFVRLARGDWLVSRVADPVDLPFLPKGTFAAADPSLMSAGVLGEVNLNPPENDRVAFEAAKEHATQTAKKLIDVALSDADGILGAYLKGLPQSGGGPQNPPWASFSTPVAQLGNRKDLGFEAASNQLAADAYSCEIRF